MHNSDKERLRFHSLLCLSLSTSSEDLLPAQAFDNTTFTPDSEESSWWKASESITEEDRPCSEALLCPSGLCSLPTRRRIQFYERISKDKKNLCEFNCASLKCVYSSHKVFLFLTQLSQMNPPSVPSSMQMPLSSVCRLYRRMYRLRLTLLYFKSIQQQSS